MLNDYAAVGMDSADRDASTMQGKSRQDWVPQTPKRKSEGRNGHDEMGHGYSGPGVPGNDP